MDVSAGAMLSGDVPRGLEHARAALSLAEQSGHSRTKLAASINMAQALEMQGDTEAAKQCLDHVVESARGNRHLLRAAIDGLANVWITRGDFARAREVFSAADDDFADQPSAALKWDSISELNSRARLELAEARWAEGELILRRALAIAKQSEDAVWVFRLSVSVARCLAMMGRVEESVMALPQPSIDRPLEPELLSQYLCALATIHHSAGRFGRFWIESAACPSSCGRTREFLSRSRSDVWA